MKNTIKLLGLLLVAFLFSINSYGQSKEKHNKKKDKEYYNNDNYNYNNNNDRYSKDRYDNRKNYNNQDLVGRSALNAYSTLRNRNFYEQKTHQQGGNTYKVWYNRNSRQCIKTTSRDRRITSIVPSTHCR